jgi:cysteinyl-tRNA synthetase
LVMVDNQKMSKSLGNFYTIKDALMNHIPDVVRHVILSHNYSSSIDFSKDSFVAAETRVFYYYKTLQQVLSFLSDNAGTSMPPNKERGGLMRVFIESMDDNFSTAKVMAALSRSFARANTVLNDASMPTEGKVAILSEFSNHMAEISEVLRFLNDSPPVIVEGMKNRHLQRVGLDREELERKIEERLLAKQAKDYDRADSIRDSLIQAGIKLLDNDGKCEWEIEFG